MKHKQTAQECDDIEPECRRGVNRTKQAWLEEYCVCGCTFMAWTKGELLGYCQKHGNSRRNVYKLPAAADMEMGHAG